MAFPQHNPLKKKKKKKKKILRLQRKVNSAVLHDSIGMDTKVSSPPAGINYLEFRSACCDMDIYLFCWVNLLNIGRKCYIRWAISVVQHVIPFADAGGEKGNF